MKTHARDDQIDDDMERPGFVWAKCGKAIHEAHIADNTHDITCGSCDRILKTEAAMKEAAETAA